MKRIKQIGVSCILMAILGLPGSLLAGPEEAKKIAPIISFLLLQAGKKFEAIVTNILNDTGIDFTGDPAGCSPNDSGCSINADYPQDCHAGRDAIHNDDSDGHAGFSFAKLDSFGRQMSARAGYWKCVGDKVTGLMWEVKAPRNGTAGDSLHDGDDEYTWYNTNPSNNGGAEGTENSEMACFGHQPGQPATYCNIQAYVARVNSAGWCGHSDWRLPTREELRSIVDYSKNVPASNGNPASNDGPAIDGAYFSGVFSDIYWSSTASTPGGLSAWGIGFGNGVADKSLKSDSALVRLVRSEQ